MQDQHTQSRYDQGAGLELLTKLLGCLEDKTVVDLGAERGDFVRALLEAGAEAVYAFESSPSKVAALRAAFAETPSVGIFDLAVCERDAGDSLSRIEDLSGPTDGAFQPVVAVEEGSVERRTLASLVAEEIIPVRIGVLKLHAGRGSLATLCDMKPLVSAVVLVEHGQHLAESAEQPDHESDDLARFMAENGYRNFVMSTQVDPFEMLLVNDLTTRPGERATVIFIHDTAFAQLAGAIYSEVAVVQRRLADTAAILAGAATRGAGLGEGDQGLRQIELDDTLATRLELLEEQEQALEAYLRLVPEGGPWKWVAPQLGVLYQHEPEPFQVPEHYVRAGELASPPLISIVTPTMNSELFLPFTINSVIGQGYPNLEYVIQDGDSTDDTLKIVESFGSSISHATSARDSGMSEAINRGFQHTTGDVMAYLNSDDLLLPGTLNYVAVYFANHPEVDVVYGHRVIVNMDNAEIGRWVLPPHDAEVLTWADYVPQETLFWRRRIWEQVGGAMDETFRFACDWDLLLRFREAGATFTRLPRFLGAFRVHEEQKTSKQLADIGASEMNRLREHYAGRPVAPDEVWRYLQPYMYRHKVYHKLYRIGVLRY